MSARKLVIAIDGPAGSGKSTIASRLARKFGYINLESGAMYRALALKAIERGADLDDEAAMRALAEQSRIELIPREDGNSVLLDGRDVSQRIREADVTAAASRVSVHASVRRIMVERQRAMGEQGGVVMEGRDIGTVVFPNADVKVFLDADATVRAERRLAQNAAAANDAQQVRAELADRDRRDQTRAASPLVAAADAVHIDSTHKSIDEVVADIEGILRSKLASLG
jgi:cytidylate kinase